MSKCVSCRLINWGECFFILFFVCFVLFQFACFYFNLSCFYLVDVYFPKQRYKGCRIDVRKGVENLRGVEKGGKYNHNIFYEKKSTLNQKKNKMPLFVLMIRIMCILLYCSVERS